MRGRLPTLSMAVLMAAAPRAWTPCCSAAAQQQARGLHHFEWLDREGRRRRGGRSPRICDIRSYGAVPGSTNATHAGPSSTRAIQRAIDDCALAAGGTVLVPAGQTFVTGSLFLKSNITLFVAKGATLLGATARDAWRTDGSDAPEYPWVYDRLDWWGMFRASLINGPRCTAHPACPTPAQNRTTPHCGPNKTFGDLCAAREKLHNVVITGEGTIDGNARNPGFHGGWWDAGARTNRNRPLLVSPSFVDGLTIHGRLTFTGGANWQTHPMFCNHVWITNLTVNSVGVPNGDGIDPDSCQNVLIEDSNLETGDDCIAIKSGRNEDGLADNASTANVVIRNMVFGVGHGISIGSETSGGVHNVTLTNLTMVGTANGMRVKSARGRGNSVTNIVYENMVMRGVGAYPITVNMDYGDACAEWTGECALPRFENFTVRNVVSDGSGLGMRFACLNSSRCTGFQFTNITIRGARGGYECAYVYGSARNVTPSMDACLNHGGPPPKPPPRPPPPPKHRCAAQAANQRCFDDSMSGSLLPVPEPATHDKTTLEVCASACFDGQHTLAGIDAGNHCWCGAESDLSGAAAKAKSRPLAECESTPCHADKAEKCGGTDRLLVYHFACDELQGGALGRG